MYLQLVNATMAVVAAVGCVLTISYATMVMVAAVGYVLTVS